MCAGTFALPCFAQSGGNGGEHSESGSVFGLSEVRRRFFDTLFDTELPFTNPDSAWEFSIHPKFSDVVDEDFIRLPYDFRYGFTEKREGLIGHTPYFNNPFASNADSSLGYLNLGIKQRIDSFGDQWQVAVGAKAKLPMEDIPSDPWDIRADFAQYEPYIVIGHQDHPLSRWQQVLNVSYRWVDDSPFGVDTQVTEIPHSLLTLRPGLIYKPPGEWRYSLEFQYVTERLDGGKNDAYMIVPGVTWFPNRIDHSIPVPGDFEVGLTIGFAFEQLPEDRDSSEIKAAVRVRWRLDSQSKERLKKYLKGDAEEPE